MPVTDAEKAAWLSEKTWKGKARLEHELALRHHLRFAHLAAELGCGSSWGRRHVEIRNVFWRAGSAAEPMWAELEANEQKTKKREKPIGLETLRNIFRAAKQKAEKAKVELTERHVSNALRFYKKKQHKKGVSAARGLRKRRLTERFELAKLEAARLLEGLDPEKASRLRKQFAASLDIAWDTLVRDAAREASVNQLSVTLMLPRKKDFFAACQTLLIDPPSYGRQIDPNLIRRQRFALLKHYHPDANSAPGAEENYKTVQNAVSVVQMYNAVLTRKAAS